MSMTNKKRGWSAPLAPLAAVASIAANLVQRSDRKMNTLRDYQLDAVNAVMRDLADGYRAPLVVMACGMGKAQPVDERVLTQDGWRCIGDLVVGDFVVGADGKPTQVVGVYPQGKREAFEVVFTDGARTTCDGEHLWAVKTPSRRRRNQAYRVLTLNQLAAEGLKVGGVGWRHFIPMPMPVEGHYNPLPLDPYLLGVLLGDGSLASTGIMVHAEHDLVRSVQLPAGCAFKFVQGCGTGVVAGSYRIGGSMGCTTNIVMAGVRALGLEGKTSHTKFVPEQYLLADADRRLALLQGIMDTDGYVSRDNHVELIIVSKHLAAVVTNLVRSLGGTASRHNKRTSWTYKGVHKTGSAIRLSIQMPGNLCPFRWKSARWKARPKYQPARAICQVRRIGLKEVVCINVQASDHLYITRDYVVTHNTEVFIEVARRWLLDPLNGRVLVIAHRRELILQARLRLKCAGLDSGLLVESVQSLHARLKRGQPMPGGVGMVILDEAHHGTSRTNREVLAEFPDAVLVGVTATPDRADGIALGVVFDKVSYVRDARQGIRDGFLTPVTKITCSTTPELAGMIRGRRAIVFADSVESSRAMTRQLGEHGVMASHVDGTTPKSIRDAVMSSLRAGRIQCVVNFNLISEGVDVPACDLVAIMRNVGSRPAFAQIAGRGMRPSEGKRECLLVQLPGARELGLLPERAALEGQPVKNRVRRKFTRRRQVSRPAPAQFQTAPPFSGFRAVLGSIGRWLGVHGS